MTKKTKVKQAIEFKKTIIKGREFDTFNLIVNGKNTKCCFGEDEEDDNEQEGKLIFDELTIHKERAYQFLKDLKCVQFPTEYNIRVNPEIPLKYGELSVLKFAKHEDVFALDAVVIFMEDDMKNTDLNSLKLMNSILNKLETNYPKNIRATYDFGTAGLPEEENRMYAFSLDYFGEMKGTLANQVNNLTEMLIKTQLEIEKEMIANIKKRKIGL